MLVRDKCEMKDIGMSEFFRALLIDGTREHIYSA